MLDLMDIQLPIIQNAGEHARYLFLAFGSQANAARWLARVLPTIAPAGMPDRYPHARINVAFTLDGLRLLGLPDELLDSFPFEFREGMARRASKLGLNGPSSPENWEMGDPSRSEVHAAVFLFAPSAEARDAEGNALRARIEAEDGVDLVAEPLDADALPGWREHFGYVDGISQPSIADPQISPAYEGEPRIAAGEFILGYPDEVGETALNPRGWIATNGSFLAYQKIHEDVAAFRAFLADNAPDGDQELFAAKLMGRWRSGVPLAASPDADDRSLLSDPRALNAFGYAEKDPRGYACPIGSHVRRMNPRDARDDSNRHRVIRRGLPYGPALPEGVTIDDGVDRGMAGFFFNASLGRQYEVLQMSWVNDPKFQGLQNDVDPIVGDNDETYDFTIQRSPIPRRIKGIKRFTRVEAGAYFFMPGMRALERLVNGELEGAEH